MNLKELDSFKLNDAVSFHDELNPAIFMGDTMKSKVRDQLLLIAQDFIEHLGINNLNVADITVSGSNAAYSYTDHSDIDLHILVDMNELNNDVIYRELFDAKKNLYNDKHDITIGGFDVELYVQDTNKPVISLGEYSVLFDKWLRLPKKHRASLDQIAARLKFEKLLKLAGLALKHSNEESIHYLLSTIKKYRQSGLDLHGEFGPENLAYKALRSKGIIQKLYDRLDKLHADSLSLPEGIGESTPLDKKRMAVSELEEGRRSWDNWKSTATDLPTLLDAFINDLNRYFRNKLSYHNEGNKVIASYKNNPVAIFDKETKQGKLLEASGYIPTEKEKNDSRFKTALTVDVTPNSIRDNAKKLGSKISRAGIPPLLRK